VCVCVPACARVFVVECGCVAFVVPDMFEFCQHGQTNSSMSFCSQTVHLLDSTPMLSQRAAKWISVSNDLGPARKEFMRKHTPSTDADANDDAAESVKRKPAARAPEDDDTSDEKPLAMKKRKLPGSFAVEEPEKPTKLEKQAEKAEKADNADKPQKRTKLEKQAEKAEKADNADKPEKRTKLEKQAEKAAKKAEKAAKREKPTKLEKQLEKQAEKADKADKPEKRKKLETQAETAAKKAETAAKREKSDSSDKAGKSEKQAEKQSEKPEKTERKVTRKTSDEKPKETASASGSVHDAFTVPEAPDIPEGMCFRSWHELPDGSYKL